jgi:geranylgeranyl diphosphate synthase type II
MRYAALAPGKRVRPLLVLTACEAAGGDWRRALPAAAALELVHAFSLVHDDLPALDDDDFRRGRPTTHRRYGEAVALLAGDALLALSFETLAGLARAGVGASRVAEAQRVLARASGSRELVGGQVLDLEAEGGRVREREVRAIHQRKTGALTGAALALGALVAGARPTRVRAMERLGRSLGVAFQIQDDLLNRTASLGQLGKRGGTDAARGKATYPAALGEERSRRTARAAFARARAAIARLGAGGANLLRLVAAIEARTR